MLTFQQAAELYRTKRKNKDGAVRLAHETWLIAVGSASVNSQFKIRYHATDIVTIHPDDTYTLTTGGWFTPTTKARIQEYAPVRLASVGGLWYLRAQAGEYNPVYEYLFRDGFTVDTYGVPQGYNPVVAALIEKQKKQIDRDVSKYITGFAVHIREHGLSQPSGGDCWGCSMHEVTGTVAEPMGLDHYQEHFTEGYYVPSLLYNAILEKGYPNPGYIWDDIRREAERGRDSWLLSNALRSFFGRRKPALLGLTGIVPVKTGPVTIGQAIGASQARAKAGR